MKRYDPAWHEPSLMEEEPVGEWVKHADHAAFVARVREIAEKGQFHSSPRAMIELFSELLALCEVTNG